MKPGEYEREAPWSGRGRIGSVLEGTGDAGDELPNSSGRFTLIAEQRSDPAYSQASDVASAECFGILVSIDLVSAGLAGGGIELATGERSSLPHSLAKIQIGVTVPDDPLAVMVAGAIRDSLPKALAGARRFQDMDAGAAVTAPERESGRVTAGGLSDRPIREIFAASVFLARLGDDLADSTNSRLLEAALAHLDTAISDLRADALQSEGEPGQGRSRSIDDDEKNCEIYDLPHASGSLRRPEWQAGGTLCSMRDACRGPASGP